ncbi:hypothetical protein ScPMuIL_016468 [Solemya velum]
MKISICQCVFFLVCTSHAGVYASLDPYSALAFPQNLTIPHIHADGLCRSPQSWVLQVNENDTVTVEVVENSLNGSKACTPSDTNVAFYDGVDRENYLLSPCNDSLVQFSGTRSSMVVEYTGDCRNTTMTLVYCKTPENGKGCNTSLYETTDVTYERTRFEPSFKGYNMYRTGVYRWLFRSYRGNRILLSVTKDSNCSDPDVELLFYDGFNTSAPVLFALNGTTTGHTYQSSSEYVFLYGNGRGCWKDFNILLIALPSGLPGCGAISGVNAQKLIVATRRGQGRFLRYVSGPDDELLVRFCVHANTGVQRTERQSLFSSGSVLITVPDHQVPGLGPFRVVDEMIRTILHTTYLSPQIHISRSDETFMCLYMSIGQRLHLYSATRTVLPADDNNKAPNVTVCEPPSEKSFIVESQVGRVAFIPSSNYTKRYFEIAYRAIYKVQSLPKECLGSYHAYNIIVASRSVVNAGSYWYTGYYPRYFSEDWLIAKEFENDTLHIDFYVMDLAPSLMCPNGDHVEVCEPNGTLNGCSSCIANTYICDRQKSEYTFNGNSYVTLSFRSGGDKTHHKGFEFTVETTVPPLIPCGTTDDVSVDFGELKSISTELSHTRVDRCWVLRGQHGTNIVVTVLGLRLYGGTIQDKLTIYDADRSKELISLDHLAVRTKMSYTSTSSTMSNGGDCLNAVPSSNRYQADYAEQTIPTYHYPLLDNRLKVFEWIIEKPNALDNLVMDIDYKKACDVGASIVWAGACNDGRRIAKVCGYTRKRTYSDSSNRYVHIQFKSFGNTYFKISFQINVDNAEEKEPLALPTYAIIIICIVVLGFLLAFFYFAYTRYRRTKLPTPGLSYQHPPSSHTPLPSAVMRTERTDESYSSASPPSYNDVIQNGYEMSRTIPTVIGTTDNLQAISEAPPLTIRNLLIQTTDNKKRVTQIRTTVLTENTTL